MWDLYLWRPVMVEKALFFELKEYWLLDDLVTFHELQDIEDAHREEQNAKINSK